MRILLIDMHYGNSSTGKIVQDLSCYYKSGFHDVKCLYGRGENFHSKDNSIVKTSYDFETYVHAALTRVTGYTGSFSPLSTKRMLKEIDSFRPDIVHIHELHGYYVDLYTVVSWLIKSNIKVVWTFHCEFMYTGKCGHAYSCERWKSGCGDCPSLQEYPASYIDRTASMFLDKKRLFENFNNLRIVAPSSWLLGRVRQSFLSKKKSTVIYNGINTSEIFYPRNSVPAKLNHLDLSKPTLLAVAPDILDDRKGGEWVIKLAKRFGTGFNFILVGVNDLSRLYPDNVFVFPRTSDQIELAEFYSVADLFLICSKRENFPTTCLESLSCGTPVVGFDEGGTRETAPAPYGKFVGYGNLDEMERVIRNHFNGHNKLADADSCRDYAVRTYSREVMAENYLNLYFELMEN